MHVFITGGTGTIGAAVIAELVEHDHTVLALARSDGSAEALQKAGAEVLRGDLSDLDVLRAGAAKAGGVINLAFGRDYGSPDAIARSIAEETAALHALADALRGSERPLVMVSGTPWIPGRVSTEEDPLPTEGPVGGRSRTVTALLAQAPHLRGMAVRLPRTVHNEGKGGFAGLMTDLARQAGIAGYPGDGSQRWPAVHALDAAVLFRRVLESAPAGSSWHAVNDEGDTVRDILTVIGRRLGLPVESLAQEKFGPFGPIFAMDQPASSARTRAALGWTPTHPHLLADLEKIVP